jgi:UDP-glucuronate 4-epimerase
MELDKSKAVLVTGCAGFIGYHVCKRLLKEGFIVYGIDNFNDYYDRGLKINRIQQISYSPFILYEIDLADYSRIDNFLKGFSTSVGYVIHLAAQAGVRHSFEDPFSYIQSNVVGFSNLIEACKRYCPNLEHFVFASSSSVYGASKIIPFRTTARIQ